MPLVRDGRGVLTEYDMSAQPTGSPSGPVERRLGPVAPAPDSPSLPAPVDALAASRARGAAAAGFVKGRPGPKVGTKRSDEARARMAIAQKAAWERRRATAPSAPEPTPEPTPVAAVPPAQAEPPDAPQPSRGHALPCTSCLHADVCSIRPQLEAWVRNLKPPTKPHAALQVNVAVDVACDHFLASS
jgi:hypothetical protein